MRCCWRSSVRRVDSVGCAVNTGSMLTCPSSAIDLLAATARANAACAKHSSSPPGCGVLLSFMYWRRRRTRCTFSAMLTIWNQAENARISSRASVGGRSCVRTTSSHAVLGVALAAADGGLPVTLDGVEELVAALVPDHLADELAERMHVVAQRRVLDREKDAFAGHGRGVGGLAAGCWSVGGAPVGGWI